MNPIRKTYVQIISQREVIHFIVIIITGCIQRIKKQNPKTKYPVRQQNPGHFFTETFAGQFYYCLNDHLGTTRVIIDETGAVKEFYDYYPFGKIRRSQIADLPVGKYKFTGKELDDENGLDWYDFGARAYDAGIGRWVVADAMFDDYPFLSPYAYAANNPLKFIDIKGEDIAIVVSGEVKRVVTKWGPYSSQWDQWKERDKNKHFATYSMLPPEIQQQTAAVQAKQRTLKVILISGAVFLLLWFLVNIFGYFMNRKQVATQAALQQVNSRILAIENLKRENERLTRDLKQVQSILAKRSQTSQVFHEISRIMPENVWLRFISSPLPRKGTSQTGGDKSKLILTGLAFSEKDVTLLLRAFESSSLFDNIRLVQTEGLSEETVWQKTRIRRVGLVRFEVEVANREN